MMPSSFAEEYHMKRAGVPSCACLFLSLLLVGCGPQQGATHPTGGNGVPDGGYGDDCQTPPKDSDGDGISDHDEGGDVSPARDTDGDGTPDYLDSDSDGDGIPDSVEGGNATPCMAPVDTDGDGKPDFVDLDSDDANDATVADREEAGPDPTHPLDSDGDGIPDYRDDDNDGDGIVDKLELTAQGASVAAMKLADAPDTDADGIPDFLDTDSDGDGIPDLTDGAVDTDGDLIPNYRDLDSDGDCVPDALELAVDSDMDGAPDFADVDSDNDGLTDGIEDKNCNGMVDACETDRKKADTDGDGVSDLVEVADCAAKPAAQQAVCMCQATNPAQSPLQSGDFVFVVDYNLPPSPTSETLSLSTDVAQADVIFSIDTTGSMGSALSNLQAGLSNVAASVQMKVKSVAMGIMDFRDFTSDDPYIVSYDYRITTVSTAAGLTALQNSLNGLMIGDGGDGPEAGWEALYNIAGGPALSATALGHTWTSAITAPQPNPVPAGETQGTLGGALFRAGSVPIVVTVSDAEWHDAPGTAANGEDGLNDYGSAENGVPTRAAAIARANLLTAHVMGIAGHSGSATGNAKARAIATANATGAVVKPADFGPVGTRPSTCAITQCCTSDGGAGEAPDASGNCPLAYGYNDTNGNGVGSAVTSGIVALANGLKFDIHVEASDVDPMTIDRFMLKLVPNLSGMGPAAMCVTMTPTPLQDNFTGPKAAPGGDGVLDTFPGIGGGQQICFDVIPKMNTTVMNTDKPQMFHAVLNVKGVSNGNTVNLGVPRDVFFLVPPKIMNGPIP
jgi:hypothetical protein